MKEISTPHNRYSTKAQVTTACVVAIADTLRGPNDLRLLCHFWEDFLTLTSNLCCLHHNGILWLHFVIFSSFSLSTLVYTLHIWPHHIPASVPEVTTLGRYINQFIVIVIIIIII